MSRAIGIFIYGRERQTHAKTLGYDFEGTIDAYGGISMKKIKRAGFADATTKGMV